MFLGHPAGTQRGRLAPSPWVAVGPERRNRYVALSSGRLPSCSWARAALAPQKARRSSSPSRSLRVSGWGFVVANDGSWEGPPAAPASAAGEDATEAGCPPPPTSSAPVASAGAKKSPPGVSSPRKKSTAKDTPSAAARRLASATRLVRAGSASRTSASLTVCASVSRAATADLWSVRIDHRPRPRHVVCVCVCRTARRAGSRRSQLCLRAAGGLSVHPTPE